jgi:hypothetical protein
MATTTVGNFTVTRLEVTIRSDQSTSIWLQYTNGAGALVATRNVTVDPAGVSPVVDQNGTVLAATPPAALVTAISTFKTQIDSLISSAATAGKLNL